MPSLNVKCLITKLSASSIFKILTFLVPVNVKPLPSMVKSSISLIVRVLLDGRAISFRKIIVAALPKLEIVTSALAISDTLVTRYSDTAVGFAVGSGKGTFVGSAVGIKVGKRVGKVVGYRDGKDEGEGVGTKVGKVVGRAVPFTGQ